MPSSQPKKDRTCTICRNVGICNHPCCRHCDLRFLDRKAYSEHNAIEHPACTYCNTKFMKKEEYHEHIVECKRIYEEKQRIMEEQRTQKEREEQELIQRNEARKDQEFSEYTSFIKERYRPTMNHCELAHLIIEVFRKANDNLEIDVSSYNFDGSADNVEKYIDPMDLHEFSNTLENHIKSEFK
jgi:hypothetical protein